MPNPNAELELVKLDEAQYAELEPMLSGHWRSSWTSHLLDFIARGEDGDKFKIESRNVVGEIKTLSGRVSAFRKNHEDVYPFKVSVRVLKDKSAAVIMRLPLD